MGPPPISVTVPCNSVPPWLRSKSTATFPSHQTNSGFQVAWSPRLAEIESEIRYFVPLGENLEIWELTITNHRQETASLSIFSVVEFCLWDALDDATNFQRNYSIGELEVDDEVIYHKSEYRERRNHLITQCWLTR